MNTFRKVGNTWMIVSERKQEDGATVPVTLKSGGSKPVKLGRIMGYLYAVDASEQQARRSQWQDRQDDEQGYRDDQRN